jgi:sodium transport system permease protein
MPERWHERDIFVRGVRMRAVRRVFAKEVLESLRDRRILINTLLVGPLIGPLVFAIMINFIVSQEQSKAEKPLPVSVINR